MTANVHATRTPPGRLREARRQLLEAGDLDGGLPPTAAHRVRRMLRARNWRARWSIGAPWCRMRVR